MSRRYYPLFVDLKGRRCVVVGGGAIAQRKALALVRSGASVSVISPTVTPRLQAVARQGRLRHIARWVRSDDLRGSWLVISATNDPAINARVARAAKRLRIFVNVVDQSALCSFIAPAIFQRGLLTVAFSTAGASPLMAKRLRRAFARRLGGEHARMLRLLEALRPAVHARLRLPAARKRYFESLLDGPLNQLVRRGDFNKARQRAMRMLIRWRSHHGAAVATHE